MQFTYLFTLCLWILPTWATLSSMGLDDFFIYRKTQGTTFSDDDIVNEAMQNKEFFFKVMGSVGNNLGMRIFTNALILGLASFAHEVTPIEMRLLCFQASLPFNILPRLLPTPKMRRQALQFFIQRPEYTTDGPECHKMLLLLFCEFENSSCELTKDTLQPIIDSIIRSVDLLKSLTISLLNLRIDQGLQFCFNLCFYYSFSIGKIDKFLSEHFTYALEYSSETIQDGLPVPTQIDSFACPIEILLSQFPFSESPLFKGFIEFVESCDKVFVEQILEQMKNACIERKLWESLKYIMRFVPRNAHYDYFKSFGNNLDSSTVEQFIPSFGRLNYLTNLYILSRFSSSSSNAVRDCILILEPALKAYEPDDADVKNWVGECKLPEEILLLILSLTDPITQLQAVPLVCRAWRRVRELLLERSFAIHTLFMSDTSNEGIDNFLCILPWRAVFSCRMEALKLFGRIGNLYCPISGSIEHRLMAQEYLSRAICYQAHNGLPAVEFYLQEYIRIVESTDWVDNPPIMERPIHFTMMQYGEVIRRLVKEYSSMPRIPWDFMQEILIELYEAIQDDDVFEKIFIKDCQHNEICASILVQQIAIPTGISRILTSHFAKFKRLCSLNIAIPLTLDTLGTKTGLMMYIIKFSGRKFRKLAYEWLVRVLCHFQGNPDRISALTEDLRFVLVFCCSDYPLLYMLNNPQQFSIEQFKLVKKVVVDSGLCKIEKLEMLPIFYRQSDPAAST